MNLKVRSISDSTLSDGMREIAEIVAGANPATLEAIRPQIVYLLECGARHLDRVQKELVCERQINEMLRTPVIEAKPRPDYGWRVVFVVCALGAFAAWWKLSGFFSEWIIK